MTKETLEQRVERIEKHLSKKSWLDEPAIINGEYVYMGDKFPIEAKLFFGLIIACGLALLAVLIWAKVTT